MNIYHCKDNQDFPATDTNEAYDSTGGIEMDSTEHEKADAEFHLANDMMHASPRSGHSGGSSSEVFASPTGRESNARQRPKSARVSTPKTMIVRPTPLLSSIPLPVKSSGPIKIPCLLKNVRTSSRTNSIAPRSTSLANKHTLEIQFINKNKRYVQMRKELVEKQRPIFDLYQNLTQIKKRLEGLGKTVKLEEIRLVPCEDYNKMPSSGSMGAGEQVSMEVVNSMKSSIEEIPKTLMDICKNLLSRRALIVELLESVTKSEVDVTQVSDKIESLKCEGQQLQRSLDAVIQEHEAKISDLVTNWQKLLNDKQCFNTDSRIDELEHKVKEEEELREESSRMIHDLHRKMEERRILYDKSVAELNGVHQTLKEQIKKLEQDLDTERKASADFKNRNTTNAQSLKSTRSRITELETEKKDVETSNFELQKKIRLLQDQLKHKESQFTKEKEELNKSLKHQENLLQKLTADKNQFETRLGTIETSKQSTEQVFKTNISSLEKQLELTRTQLAQVTKEKNEAVEKCSGFESYVARVGAECKESMNKVSYSIEWGKAAREVKLPEADNYVQEVVKDLRIRELEDRINELERGQKSCEDKRDDNIPPSKMELDLMDQKERVRSYELLLEESENELKNKSTEVENLRAEIRQLKVRQESMDEQNERCSLQEMKDALEDGRHKLNELMTRSIKNENKIEEYQALVEKQKIQMNEMDNLLRYRENMANVLKSSRNEMLLEKDSLARYSREVRGALAEVTSRGTMKDTLITSLQEKLTVRETQIGKFEKEIKTLEKELQITNGKRYKLQDRVGTLERELQQTREKIDRMSGIGNNAPTLPWSLLDSVCEVVEDKSNKKVSQYCNSLIERPNVNKLDLEEQHPKLRELCDEQKTFQSDYFTSPSSLRSSDYSSNKLSHQNVSVADNTASSVHTHCHHKANSRSLISLSLQTVDFIKTKLNFLSSVNMALPENPVDGHQESMQTQIISSTQTTPSNQNLNKIMQLTAHRYEYLHNQAQESYDDLANLVKLAVAQKGGVKK